MDDRFVEQAFGARHCHHDRDHRAPARLAEDGDVIGIAAENRDVVTDPFERLNDIQHAGGIWLSEPFVLVTKIDEPKYFQPMIKGDND